MQINQNIMAVNAQRNLATTQTDMGKTLEKLSSGLRINRAADDAAGLTISEGLRSEVRGSEQAIRNAQDGVSWVQTAEGALTEVHEMLQRVRELAVQASNETTDGSAEQSEIDELMQEIDAIGSRTQFAGQDVFDNHDGDNGGEPVVFQVGANGGDTIEISLDLRIETDGENGFLNEDIAAGEEVGNIDVETADSGDFETILDNLDTAIANVSETRSNLGATQNRLEHTVANVQVTVENLTASESRIRDADMAQEMVDFTRHQILQQSGTAMLAQANQVPQSVLSLLG